jgi:hypothetical protein
MYHLPVQKKTLKHDGQTTQLIKECTIFILVDFAKAFTAKIFNVLRQGYPRCGVHVNMMAI